MPGSYLGENPDLHSTGSADHKMQFNNHYEEDAAWCTEEEDLVDRIMEEDGWFNTDEEDEDLVEQPSHYAQYFIEPITYIERNGFSFWRGNIIKYASRAGSKIYPGKTDNESEILDLQKVIRYAQIRINLLNGETKL